MASPEHGPEKTKVMLVVVGIDVGGTEAHVLDLASRMDHTRFDVQVCSLKPLGRLGQELTARGVRVMSLDGAGKCDLRILGRLWRLIKAEQPDVVQAFLFFANVATRLARGAWVGAKVVSSYHDEIVQEGWLNRWIDRLTMRWTDRVVCCSWAVAGSVKSRIGGWERVFDVIPFGVEAERFSSAKPVVRESLGLQPGLPIVGTICRLVEPKKGLAVLLAAVARLEDQAGSPVCQLLLVGDGPARKALTGLSHKLGIAPRVVFAGVRRDIPEMLSLIDVFVLPSLYEGFGIAILEAMAAAKPIVATTVGGIPEFVKSEETGLLVPPGNPNALAAAVKRLLDRPVLARAMGVQGQEHVRRSFSIESVVKQHEQLYEWCMARP